MQMIVTIWRHGEAGSAAVDSARELTDRGTDDVGFGCQQFDEHCEARELPHPDRILYSPYTRTVETADIIASAFNHASLAACEQLQPGHHVHDIDYLLEQIFMTPPQPAHLLLVSHQPLVSSLVDFWLGEPGRVPGLSPGGLASLAMETAGPATARLLFWSLPPEFGARQ